MSNANLEAYDYLWDGSAAGWVILESSDLTGGACVVNEVSSVLLHIEDKNLKREIIQRMKEMGCKVIGSMPRTEPLKVEIRE